MKNIIVLCGGKSAERDISLITENLVLNAIDTKKYNVYPIVVDKNNHWFYIKDFKNNIQNQSIPKKEVYLKFGEKHLYVKTTFGLKKLVDVDCAILCHHGLFGEDGTIQGILEYCNIPYTSSKVLSSSISMDKVIMKLLFKEFGFNVVDYEYFDKDDYLLNEQKIIDDITKKLDYPLIIKPANLGSSIGINVAKNVEELRKGIETALFFDEKILIEKQIENFREINCAVLGYKNDYIVSSLEEPVSYKEFLSFDDKYLFDKKGKQREYPANIDKKIEIKIKKMSADIFRKFELSGVVRIDYIVKDDVVYVNEINSIPGSMAYYLFEKEKLSFSEIIDKLIDFGMEKNADKNLLTYAYKSNVLEKGNVKK